MSEFLSELLTARLFRFIILSHLCFMKIYYKESKFLQRWWKKKGGTAQSRESKDTGIGGKKSRRQTGCLTEGAVTRGDPHHAQARFNPQKVRFVRLHFSTSLAPAQLEEVYFSTLQLLMRRYKHGNTTWAQSIANGIPLCSHFTRVAAVCEQSDSAAAMSLKRHFL